MKTPFQELAEAVKAFAREELSRRARRLDSFLPLPEQLIKAMDSFVATQDIAQLQTVNRILRDFASGSSSRTRFAESGDSLDRLRRLARAVSQKVPACIKEPLSEELRKELRLLDQRMQDIARFLARRQDAYIRLQNFRI